MSNKLIQYCKNVIIVFSLMLRNKKVIIIFYITELFIFKFCGLEDKII